MCTGVFLNNKSDVWNLNYVGIALRKRRRSHVLFLVRFSIDCFCLSYGRGRNTVVFHDKSEVCSFSYLNMDCDLPN